jgi:hypothetical protein
MDDAAHVVWEERDENSMCAKYLQISRYLQTAYD